MAINLGSLFFRLGADTKGLEKAKIATKALTKEAVKAGRFSAKGMAKARDATLAAAAATRKQASAAKRAGQAGKIAGDKTAASFKRGKKQLDSTQKAMRGLAKLLLTVLGVRAIIRIVKLADSFNVLQQRIKTATKNTGDFVRVNRRLFAITQQTGSSLKTNVGLFQALARASAELGATNSQMLDLTQTVNQLGVISGSTNDELKFGVRQFTQGLSSGIFRAEEFNSILENLPELANRIAQGMDLTVGRLRTAIIVGKIMSKDVFEALLSQTKQINEDFKDIEVSVARAGQTLLTSLQKATSEFGKSSGFLTFMAKNLVSISKSFDAISFSDIGTRLKIELGFLSKIVGLTFRRGNAERNLNTILKERRDLLSGRELVGPQIPEEIAAKRAEELEKEEQRRLKDAIQEREKIDAGRVFLKRKSLEDENQDSLVLQAKGFRDQISAAAGSSKEFFALQKALALASAALDAPSTILSAINFGTTFGGIPGGIIAGAIASAAVGTQLAAINAASFSGGRQTGGPVTPNNAFRVNEGGSGPELLTVGNKDFLLTGGQSGTITSNKDMNGGGKRFVINLNVVNNGEAVNVTTQQRDTDQGMDLDMILDRADQIVADGIRNGDGRTNSAIQATFGLNRTRGALN